MTAQTYASIQQTCVVAISAAPPPYNVLPANFTALFPQAISYAENRIYRDVPMLAERGQNVSLKTVAGSRLIFLQGMMPSQIITVEGFSIVPGAATQNVLTGPNGSPLTDPEGNPLTGPPPNPLGGTRYEYDMASLDVIDLFWPQEAVVMAPSAAEWIGRYCAMVDGVTLAIAPTPDAIYTVAITGLFQPPSLTAGNPTTYLSTFYPEVLTCACMVFLTGAMTKNFGSQADDPKVAVSWEAQYEGLISAVRAEEGRRRGLTPDRPPVPQAQAA